MSSVPVLAVPADAAGQRQTLQGPELISFFRSLSWSNVLSSYIQSTDIATAFTLLQEIESHRNALGYVSSEVPLLSDGPETIRDYLRSFYTLATPGQRDAAQIIVDIHRVWEARTSDDAGRAGAAAIIDPVFVKENPHRASLSIAKCLDALNICFDPQNPERKFGIRLQARTAAKRLLSFWESGTSPSSVSGFIGRFEGENQQDKLAASRTHWSSNLIQDLDAHEAGELASFLSEQGEAVSPRATKCRARLVALLRPESKETPPPSLSIQQEPLPLRLQISNENAPLA